MKIHIKESVDNAASINRNALNVFNIKKIISEMAEYDISVNILPQRKERNDMVSIPLQIPYVGKFGTIEADKNAAIVKLIVDYNNDGALAMSREGSDKQAMMLLSSVANKYIREPFHLDKSIKTRI